MEIGDIVMDVRKRTACKLLLNMCRDPNVNSPRGVFWNEKVALAKMVNGLNVKISEHRRELM